MADTKRVRGSKIKKTQEDIKNVTSIDEIKEDEIKTVKKIKPKKIKKEVIISDEMEQKLDKEIEHEDDLSITVMICILVLCFFVGISLGYMLYRIAINSSNAMMIVKYFLN